MKTFARITAASAALITLVCANTAAQESSTQPFATYKPQGSIWVEGYASYIPQGEPGTEKEEGLFIIPERYVLEESVSMKPIPPKEGNSFSQVVRLTMKGKDSILIRTFTATSAERTDNGRAWAVHVKPTGKYTDITDYVGDKDAYMKRYIKKTP